MRETRSTTGAYRAVEFIKKNIKLENTEKASIEDSKKVVETELRAKVTPLHAASVVGDTVGAPFKDTSSVAMNPVIKFTTLFGLLAVELALGLRGHGALLTVLSIACFFVSTIFVYRSFYGMRIKSGN